MISYEMWCKIQDCVNRKKLSFAQTARELCLNRRTVSEWAKLKHYEPREKVAHASVLDPFKGQVVRMLDAHDYSAQQVFQAVREAGYGGGYTVVKEYVRLVRPKRAPAFLKLAFAPGEAAQVDWGEWGSIAVGGTRRRLSFFVMVLCHCRMMYLEFTVSQTMEHFLAAHERAFEHFGGVPSRVIIDNLKTGVLEHLPGCAPVFNPRYLDFARHHGFAPTACNVASGHEKGRVENGVGYIKKNFLNGLDLADFSAINPAALLWLETVANVRTHGETKRRPIDMFPEEKAKLLPLNQAPYDLGRVTTVRVNKLFRVSFDANRYSVPATYAGATANLKAYPDRICIYVGEQLVARHTRCYDRNRDIENPDHPKALVAQRRNANEQRLTLRFLALTPKAADYRSNLEARRLDWRTQISRINALADTHGDVLVARAIEDALVQEAFSCDYILNLLQARARKLPEATPLQLTRRQDLLDIELPKPDLSIYEAKSHESQKAK